MNNERIKELEQLLVTRGPQTHRLKAELLPRLLKQCRDLRSAGDHQNADRIAEKIENISTQIKASEQELDAIEDELYRLRAKQHRRKLKL